MKFPKKIWLDYGGWMLWTVEQIIEPNKFDKFALLSSKRDDCVHKGGVEVVDMMVINLHYDYYYEDNKSNRKYIKELIKQQDKIEKIKNNIINFWINE